MASGNEGPIKHVVVLMLENRSYDNMLGWLYGPGNEAPFRTAPPGQSELDGLVGATYNNPNPTSNKPVIPIANQTTYTQVGGTGTQYPATTIPLIDPGEIFADMAQQFTGSTAVVTSNPYGSPPTTMDMQGFTLNYALAGGVVFLLETVQQKPTSFNYKDVMNYFTPRQVHHTSVLAHKYAVCDRWFASVPTQTFANRAFSQCAAPMVGEHLLGGVYYSYIDDSQYLTAHKPVTLPSVFSQLDASEPYGTAPYWKVYFHDYSITTLTVPYVLKAAGLSSNQNVATFDGADWPGTNMPSWLKNKPTTFVEDAASGTLPPFVFIEPRYSNSYCVPDSLGLPTDSCATQGLRPNSNHPGMANYLGHQNTLNNPPIDVEHGERFLHFVYEALLNSPCWDTTLFIVVYDEPGGLFDHVPPPAATPPGTVSWPGNPSSPPITNIPAVDDVSAAKGFGFNVYGGRVPAIIASPYISPGTTIRAPTGSVPFDHASIVKTVWDVFNLSGGTSPMPSLNQRDLNAPSLVPFLSSTPVND